MDWLTQLRSEWKMVSGAPVHFVFAVLLVGAALYLAISKAFKWRYERILENMRSSAESESARYKAEIAERNYELKMLRGQTKTSGKVDENTIPEEVYPVNTPTGTHQWTRKQIDKLPDDEKAKLKKMEPVLWRWYLGEPLHPLTYEEIENSEKDFLVP